MNMRYGVVTALAHEKITYTMGRASNKVANEYPWMLVGSHGRPSLP